MALFSSFRFNSFNVLKASLKSWTGGMKHVGFRYFPREGEKDPPFEPTKLLMVQRIKPFKGNPMYLKRILFHLKLDGKAGEIVILKNIPEINSLLYKIKHLIKITPIRTPNGIPDKDELDSGYLKENGEFVVTQRLKPNPERLKLTEQFQTDPARLDADTLIKQSRDKWLNPW